MGGYEFIEKSKGKELLAGLVSIDLVNHSQLKGNPNDIATTRKAFFDLVELEITNNFSCLFPTQGDGVIALFDLASVKTEEMIIFADKIRQLVPLFNRTFGELNRLPYQQELSVRIVCHFGMLLNKDGEAGSLYGPALNLLGKKEKEVGVTGYVVISDKIYQRLSESFKKRCLNLSEHQEFGRIYILDGDIAPCSIIKIDRASIQLRKWIASNHNRNDFDRLLYFAYTNELLFEFLGYQLDDIDIKIIVRNWVEEKKDEDKFNKQLQNDKEENRGLTRRRWFKSSTIRSRAEELREIVEYSGKSIEMRFYDSPPLFNGAILEKDSQPPCAYIGIIRWVEKPERGGSQYKLEEWPAIKLDGNNKIHYQIIENLKSRFWEIWKKGKTHSEVLEKEEDMSSKDLSVAGKIWEFDSKPYLIVYPHRKAPDRKFPVVAHEDVMAVHAIESFLNDQRINVELLSFQAPNLSDLKKDWFPDEKKNEIDNFDGHVVYICSWSLYEIKKFLLENGFPYDIIGTGTKNPCLKHIKKAQLNLRSPSDEEIPEPRDYSIIARFIRPEGKGIGYITAGIRAMGTWGAAHFLTNRDNFHLLSQMIKSKQFAAIVETTFDPKKYKVTDSRLYLVPEEF